MATFAEEYNPSFYICIQPIVTGQLSVQTSFTLPYDPNLFNAINQIKLGFELPPISKNLDNLLNAINLPTLPSSLDNNLQSFKTSNSTNVILIQVEKPTVTNDTAYNNLLALNYQSISQQQFLYFQSTTFPAVTQSLRLWQLTKAQILAITAPLGNNSLSSIIQIFNPNNIINGTPNPLQPPPVPPQTLVAGTAVEAYSLPCLSYFINFTLLLSYWGNSLYDANQPIPPLPTTGPFSPQPIPTYVDATSTTLTFTIAPIPNASPRYFYKGRLRLGSVGQPSFTSTTSPIFSPANGFTCIFGAGQNGPLDVPLVPNTAYTFDAEALTSITPPNPPLAVSGFSTPPLTQSTDP